MAGKLSTYPYFHRTVKAWSFILSRPLLRGPVIGINKPLPFTVCEVKPLSDWLMQREPYTGVSVP